jgi:hypothetical protein
MRLSVPAILFCSIAGMTAANAQSATPLLGPPVGSPPPPAAGSAPSPILTQPQLAVQPFRAAPTPAAPQPPASIDQQKMQVYRSDLYNQQRALDRQGVSPGTDQYRQIQQQLNQMNGVPR